MGEIAREMVARARVKLASGRLSEVDKSYYEHVIRDMDESPAGSGRVQEAAKPPASSAQAATGKPLAYSTFFGGTRPADDARAAADILRRRQAVGFTRGPGVPDIFRPQQVTTHFPQRRLSNHGDHFDKLRGGQQRHPDISSSRRHGPSGFAFAYRRLPAERFRRHLLATFARRPQKPSQNGNAIEPSTSGGRTPRGAYLSGCPS